MKRKKDKNGGTYVTATTKEELRTALKRGLLVEPSRELIHELGLVEDETISEAEARAARNDPAN